MSEKIKNLFSFLMRIGVSAGLLWFVFSKIDMDKTWSILKTADVRYIVWGGMIFLGTTVILLCRWFIFIKALGLEVRAIDVVRYFFIGLFGNLFLPSAMGGDILKIYGLCKNSQQKPRVFASALLDRLSGFASIVIVAVCAFVFGYKVINDRSLLFPIVIMATGSLGVIIVLFNEKVFSYICQIFNGFPKIKKPLMDMHYDIRLMHDKHKEGWTAIGMSCLSQVILSVSFFVVAKGLHQDIDLLYFLIFSPLICIASAVPSIGGLGSREFVSASLFAKIGVDSGIAVSLTLINFLFVFIVGLMGGAIYVITLFAGRVQRDASTSVSVSPSKT